MFGRASRTTPSVRIVSCVVSSWRCSRGFLGGPDRLRAMHTSFCGGDLSFTATCSKHPWAAFSYGHGVLEMCRQRTVLGGGRPAIVRDDDACAPLSHHGLYRQYEAGTENGSSSGTTEVGHLGSFVEISTDAVTHELPNYPVTSRFDDVLYGRGNIAKAGARLRLLDAGSQRLLGDFEETASFDGDVTYGESYSHVGVVAAV